MSLPASLSQSLPQSLPSSLRYSFPSIEAFRHLVKNLPYIFSDKVPDVLNFNGTVKLHGTHADVIQENNEIIIQSRNRVLSIEKDNEGCARFFEDRKQAIKTLFDKLSENIGTDHLLIAGEYCGRGIQSKVAICKLPRMFVVFAIKRLDTDQWVDILQYVDIINDKNNAIYNVCLAPTYQLAVTLETPETAIIQMDELTKQVDTKCPFADIFGVNGPGEGIVWTCVENTTSDLWFKTKGATHVTPIIPTIKNTDSLMEELIIPRMTQQRMEQGISYLVDLGHDPKLIKNINIFADWICNDIIKEELDILEDSGIPMITIRKHIRLAACEWFKTTIKFTKKELNFDLEK